MPRAQDRVRRLLAARHRTPSCSAPAASLVELRRARTSTCRSRDLARLDQVVERLQRLVDRRVGIGPVHLVQVDVVGAAAGAGWPRTTRATHRADRPRSSGSSLIGLPHLGGQHHPVAPTGERRPEELLGHAEVVDVGRVEQGDAGIERPIDHLPASLLVGVAPRPEHHRAQREGADLDAAGAELSVLHAQAKPGLALEHEAVPVVDAVGDAAVAHLEVHHAAHRDRSLVGCAFATCRRRTTSSPSAMTSSTS